MILKGLIKSNKVAELVAESAHRAFGTFHRMNFDKEPLGRLELGRPPDRLPYSIKLGTFQSIGWSSRSAQPTKFRGISVVATCTSMDEGVKNAAECCACLNIAVLKVNQSPAIEIEENLEKMETCSRRMHFAIDCNTRHISTSVDIPVVRPLESIRFSTSRFSKDASPILHLLQPLTSSIWNYDDGRQNSVSRFPYRRLANVAWFRSRTTCRTSSACTSCGLHVSTGVVSVSLGASYVNPPRIPRGLNPRQENRR